jgi:hypothetical protein
LDKIPQDVQRFVAANIATLDQLDTLLFMHRNPDRDWSPDAVCKHLGIGPKCVSAHLATWAARGFLSSSAQPDPVYRYSPVSAEDAAVVAYLADWDRNHPVKLIRMIYGRRRERYKTENS